MTVANLHILPHSNILLEPTSTEQHCSDLLLKETRGTLIGFRNIERTIHLFKYKSDALTTALRRHGLTILLTRLIPESRLLCISLPWINDLSAAITHMPQPAFPVITRKPFYCTKKRDCRGVPLFYLPVIKILKTKSQIAWEKHLLPHHGKKEHPKRTQTDRFTQNIAKNFKNTDSMRKLSYLKMERSNKRIKSRCYLTCYDVLLYAPFASFPDNDPVRHAITHGVVVYHGISTMSNVDTAPLVPSNCVAWKQNHLQG